MSNQRIGRIILCVGEDTRLLEIRCMVVSRTFQTVIACHTRELLGFSAAGVDLVVICHTLTEDQQTYVVPLIHKRWQGVRIVRIVLGGYERSGKDEVSNDPGALVRRLVQMSQEMDQPRPTAS